MYVGYTWIALNT